MTDQLIQEIDADLRAAKLDALWKQHHKKLVAVIVTLILVVAGQSIWQHYEEKRGGELMLALTGAHALYEQGKFTEAAVAFGASVPAARGDARTLTQLWQGRALMAAGQKAEAITVFKEAASARASLWSDLACLRLATLDKDAATCLASPQDSPLAAERRTWQAANDWSTGNKAKAITALEELATSNSEPDANRARFTQWLATLRATGKTPE